MDSIRNPFAPGAGSPPPELVGRGQILEKARVALGRVRIGRDARSLMLVGLHGVGKTVLLREIHKRAEADGYAAILIEAPEEKPLGALLYPSLRSLLFKLDALDKLNTVVKRGLRILKSFANSIKISVGEVEFGLDIEPELGTADSGDFSHDLGDLFVAIGEAAQARQTAVTLIIDELQYVSELEFASLITAVHLVAQKQLPLIIFGAGLPQLVGSSGKAKSYAERLFEFIEIGPLSEMDSTLALSEPVRREGIEFTADALTAIIETTQGYPYFLQEWGYESWELAGQSPINSDIVNQATRSSLAKLDKSFFRVRLDRLTPAEKNYLRAMAELGSGPHRSGDIAALLNRQVQNLGPVRSSLIRKGMVYSPSHGDTAFTVPLFDQFMRRTIPEWTQAV
jgi:AAA ATPase domain